MELGGDPDRREEAEGRLIVKGALARAEATVSIDAGRRLAAFAAAALLAATTVPAQAAKCTLARVAEWPVRQGTGQLIVDGTINDRKVGVMLDTGAVTLLLRSGAERPGLVRFDVRGARVVAIGGETGAQAVTVDEFAVGAIVQKNGA